MREKLVKGREGRPECARCHKTIVGTAYLRRVRNKWRTFHFSHQPGHRRHRSMSRSVRK